jgi:hypothetical protein
MKLQVALVVAVALGGLAMSGVAGATPLRVGSLQLRRLVQQTFNKCGGFAGQAVAGGRPGLTRGTPITGTERVGEGTTGIPGDHMGGIDRTFITDRTFIRDRTFITDHTFIADRTFITDRTFIADTIEHAVRGRIRPA